MTVRGIRSPIEGGKILGRISSGLGEVEEIDIPTLALTLAGTGYFAPPGVSGHVALPGGSTYSIQYKSGTATFGGVNPLTNGQLVIGSTGVAPVAAALTAGVGITVTNGAGSITVANSSPAVNGMLPLVTGDTTPGTGPYAITDGNGQYIGVPL